MKRPQPRRGVLRIIAGGTVALAGCSSHAVFGDSSDIVVYNRRDAPVTIRVFVKRSDESTAFHERFEIDGRGTRAFEDVLDGDDNYDVLVELDDGLAEQDEWTLPGPGGSDHLVVEVEESSIRISTLSN